MYDILNALSGNFNLEDIPRILKYKKDFSKQHPDWFYPDGILVFTGSQGSGKTLSAVNYVYNLMEHYPKRLLCSNVIIKGYEERQVFFDSIDKFKTLNNGEFGVIYLIDEIQLLFNSLESKNLDLNLFTTICQQRKQRKHIVGTSQVFNRISKGFREQFKFAVMCNNLFGFIQFNKVVKGEDVIVDESGNVKTDKVHRKFFIHSPKMYERYDTYRTIDRTNFNYKWE